MPAMCNMNMIFNWQIQDTCVVFEWWHIQTSMGMLLSCLAVFAIAAGYEYLRVWTTQLDRVALPSDNKKSDPNHQSTSSFSESDTLLHSPVRQQQILRSVMYAIMMAISFWLMLVFMTYNGYLMIATILGAGVGHYIFGQGRLPASRSISCH
ncbi:Ctr copper transporter [Hesseltinella vesiculosa]|uniref:Copper transport protein n=1 Tax=Hesseltinella vesiculosa TaxID=101127 RepID=A0A1X2GLD8_9FUNG|nr:Ctr copper transporter [Hesseltinella vesiculosa]